MTGKGQKGPSRTDDKPQSLDMELERVVRSHLEDAGKGQALRLVQREEGGPSFLIYATDRGIKAELRFEGETPWFTTRQLSEIFGVDSDTVSDHVNNFLASGELDEGATTGNF